MPRQQKYDTPTQKLSIRIPSTLMLALDREAQQQNRPRTEVIVDLLLERLPAPAAKPIDVFG